MHLARKLFHASGIVVVLIWRLFDLSRPTVIWSLGGIVLALALVDLLRAFWPPLQRLFASSLRVLLDPKDERGLNGSTLYFGGCWLAALLFPPDPACAGILALALGDASAAIVGSSVRSPRWRRISVAGSGACLVMATVGGLVFFPLPAALLGGLAATALEAFSGSKLDNLTMPLGTALALFLVA